MYTNPRRKMAVGFEDGTIHILSNVLSDVTLWRLDTVIDKGLNFSFLSLSFLKLTFSFSFSVLLMTIKYIDSVGDRQSQKRMEMEKA